MALPKIAQPTFSDIIPSTGKKIQYRPFLVKEEKILLIAAESKDKQDTYYAMKEVIQSCVTSPVDFDVNTITSYDFEYLMIKLRAVSINNEVTLKFKDKETEEIVEVVIDLNKIEPEKMSNKKAGKILITENIGMQMKAPSIGQIEELAEKKGYRNIKEFDSDNLANLTFDVMKLFIDSIWEGDDVTFAKDVSDEELDEFVNSLPVEVFEKIKNFFDSVPKLQYTHKYTNKNGTEREIRLKGYDDFF